MFSNFFLSFHLFLSLWCSTKLKRALQKFVSLLHYFIFLLQCEYADLSKHRHIVILQFLLLKLQYSSIFMQKGKL